MLSKLCLLTIVSVFLTASVWAESFKTPDILVSTRLEYDWSAYVVKTVRQYMTSNGQSDPFDRRISEPLVISEAGIDQYLDEKTRHLLKDLGQMIGLNIVNTATKVTLHGLKYNVEGLQAQMTRSHDRNSGVSVRLKVSATDVNVSADSLSLAIVIPGKNKTSSPVMDIRVVKPSISINRDDLIKFTAMVRLIDNGDHFKLSVPRTSFDAMADALVKDPSAVELDYDLDIPQVSIKVGNRTVDFSREKIEEMVRSYESSLKRLLLAELARVMTSGTIDSVLKVTEKYHLDKKVAMSATPLMSFFELSKFSTDREINTLDLEASGDFCLKTAFEVQKEACANTRKTLPSKSRIQRADHAQSLRTMDDLIENSDAALITSVSEDYINRLLGSTYDAGYWTQPLADAGVGLGSNMMMALLNEPGNTIKLVLDVVHRPKKFERLVIGSKEVRFPMIADLVARIENRNGMPHVVIQIVDVDLSEDTLLNGKPELGIISNVNELRFKKKVLGQIQEELVTIKNKVIFEMPYSILKGLKLEATEFISDGHGRMNAVLKLKSLEAIK